MAIASPVLVLSHWGKKSTERQIDAIRFNSSRGVVCTAPLPMPPRRCWISVGILQSPPVQWFIFHVVHLIVCLHMIVFLGIVLCVSYFAYRSCASAVTSFGPLSIFLFAFSLQVLGSLAWCSLGFFHVSDLAALCVILDLWYPPPLSWPLVYLSCCPSNFLPGSFYVLLWD